MLLLRVDLEHQGLAVGVAQRGLERLGEALARIGVHAQPVDHHVHRVLEVPGQARRAVEVMHLAVDAHAGEALGAQLLQQVGLLALPAGDHRREQHQPAVLRQRHHVVDHLRHGLRLQREPVVRAVGGAGAREEQAQVIVDLGDRADRGARIVARRLLLDGDGRRQAFDQVDVGLLHQLQELTRVRGEGLDVAALALGVQRVERERALAGARQAGNHHQPMARQLEADVLQVVRSGAADPDRIHW
jgi:hypothetical protein